MPRKGKKASPLGLFGWYTWDYPIAHPQFILSTLTGKKRRRKRRK